MNGPLIRIINRYPNCGTPTARIFWGYLRNDKKGPRCSFSSWSTDADLPLPLGENADLAAGAGGHDL